MLFPILFLSSISIRCRAFFINQIIPRKHFERSRVFYINKLSGYAGDINPLLQLRLLSQREHIFGGNPSGFNISELFYTG